MANSSKTIIIVPGAWHGPEHFDLVADKLRAAGYTVAPVPLKSVHTGEPLKDFGPDVETIRAAISKAVDAGQDVTLVAHSYGGIPGSQAIEGLDTNSRKEAGGKSGGVSRMFYLASFIIPEGKTLIEAFGGNDLPWFDIDADRKVVNPMTPENIFYNDMPADLTQKCVASLRPHSYQTFHSKLQWAPWAHGVPCTYLYALQDQAIPMFVQKMMVEEFAKGHHIDTETVDASHSPFYTKVDETVAAIRRAAGESV